MELVQFSDFTLPNNALANGDIDLDAFQHHLYLDSEIESYGYDLTKIATEYSTHMNLFSEKIDSIDQLKDGDVIAIPNDPTNGGAENPAGRRHPDAEGRQRVQSHGGRY